MHWNTTYTHLSELYRWHAVSPHAFQFINTEAIAGLQVKESTFMGTAEKTLVTELVFARFALSWIVVGSYFRLRHLISLACFLSPFHFIRQNVRILKRRKNGAALTHYLQWGKHEGLARSPKIICRCYTKGKSTTGVLEEQNARRTALDTGISDCWMHQKA